MADDNDKVFWDTADQARAYSFFTLIMDMAESGVPLASVLGALEVAKHRTIEIMDKRT